MPAKRTEKISVSLEYTGGKDDPKLGIYTNYPIQISAKVPFPSVPAGVAGLLLLWRWRDRVTTAAFAGFIGVLLLYVISILCATDIGFLPRHIGDGFAARGLMRALRPEIYGFDSQHFAAMRKREANSALLRAFVPELKRQARTPAAMRERVEERVN